MEVLYKRMWSSSSGLGQIMSTLLVSYARKWYYSMIARLFIFSCTQRVLADGHIIALSKACVISLYV